MTLPGMTLRTRRKQKTPRNEVVPFGVLLEQAKQGQPAAAAILYRNHVAMVHGYFRACGAGDPDDLTSEVFLGMLRSLTSFEGDHGEFRSWLMTIAHRRLVDARRRQARNPVDYLDPVLIESAVSPRAGVELLDLVLDHGLIEAFSRLTPTQREVLALRFVADLSIEGVAAILDRPLGAVKSLQHRAIEAVKRELGRAPASRGA